MSVRPPLLLLGSLLLAGCVGRMNAPHWQTGGDAHQGEIIVGRESCGACHTIPHVPQADGEVGPPLDHFAERTVIAGMLPNTPANLERWVRSPQSVTPGNAMPDSNMSQAEARDVAAYLYTLK